MDQETPMIVPTEAKPADPQSTVLSPWLKKFIKFGFAPLAIGTMLGILIALNSPRDGATLARGLLKTGTDMLAPIKLIILGILTFALRPKARHIVAVFWETYIFFLVAMGGFVAGTIAVNLTMLAHR